MHAWVDHSDYLKWKKRAAEPRVAPVFLESVRILVVGGGLKGGRHLAYPLETPMTNLLLTMLDKSGIPVDKLGDSNGKVELL